MIYDYIHLIPNYLMSYDYFQQCFSLINFDIIQVDSLYTNPMFSSLRNYSKNIDQCERFYYDNYDYYNIYENLEKDYKDDLSKFMYHCNRRNTPIIATYGQRQRFKHSRLIKNHQANNMEHFINEFVSIYMQNNYSLVSKMYEKEPCLDSFQFIQFGPLNDIKYQRFCPFKILALTKSELAECIKLIIDSNQNKIRQLEHEYQNQQQRTMKLSHAQFSFAIQQYSLRVLTGTYQSISEQQQQYSESFLLLFEFIIEVQRLMWEVISGRMRTILLMSQPKTNFLNLIVHPLVLPIMTFIKYDADRVANQMGSNAPSLYKLVSSASEKKTRIVFINLDGNQSPHNLRSISSLSQPLLYISLFNQPSWIEKAQTEMQYLFTSDDQNFTPSYGKLWQIFSQLIAKQFSQVEKASQTKFLLFPLNSTYVNRKYVQKVYQNNPNINVSQWKHSKFPRLQTSQDIHSLFQHIIYEQIRSFKPTMIFISYNGQINLLQDHFTDIIRNCSIIADHRVILFPNFTHLFQEEPLDISQQQEQAEKLLCVHQFYQKNYDYKLQNINQQRLFSNLSMFLKYGPGIYSMEDRVFGTQSSKYGMGKFYLYLEALAQIEEFKFIDKYNLKQWNSQQLTTLYDQYRNWEIKQNKKQNKYYEKLLTTIISELLCRNIPESQLQKILGPKLFYRLKFVVEQLKKQQQQAKIAIAQFSGQMGQQFAITEKQGITKLLETYLEAKKQNMLSQNLQNYKIKKHFYLAQNQKSFGQVSCFKFSLDTSAEDRQQIYLQKYSQVIINEQNDEIFIVNYKSADNRHMILHGSIKNSQIQKDITVNEVLTNDEEGFSDINDYLQHHHLSQEGQTHQKQDIVYVQYNYCLQDRNIYLFWPIRWNLKEQARCKMLGIQYKPKRIFKMLRVYQHMNQQTFRYQQIRYEPSKQQIQVLPRWGCTCQSINENYFKIFGGVYDTQNDFKMIGRGIAIAEISYNGKHKTFSINSQPKSRDNIVFSCLKPKINYVIKCSDSMSEQNALKIYGGYGRESTGFFNLFSYEEYDLDSNMVLHRANQGKFTRRIVTTEKPLQSQKIGKFNVIINNYNISQIEQKFSDTPKDKFFFEKRNEGAGKSSQWQILAFIDQAYRVNEFKIDRKKLFLFGFDRTVRQKIFLKCWSPQLYISDGIKAQIVNLSLKTQKTSSYIITNYLMPRQQDIVSLCLEQDKLYLLSNSPIIHSIDRAGLKFVLYEGSLTNINQVIRKREIQMVTKHSFEQKHERFLNQKTIFVLEEKIYLVGGLGTQNDMANSKYQRQDYVLQTNRNKFRIKTRKIQSNAINLDMPNSVVVKQHQHFLLYSISLQDTPTIVDQRQGVEWKIKIQKHMFENSEANQAKIGPFKTYAHNNQNQGKVQRFNHSSIDDPKFVRILPYVRFDKSELREALSKIMWRVDKNQLIQKKVSDLQILKKFHRQNNDKQLQIMLQNEWKIFEQLINIVKKKSDVSTEVNFQQQQLLKDLKQAYYLVSKMILEKILCLGLPQQNEHLFIAQDKSSKKVKYIAIGPLGTTKLNFFRIRFKNQLLTSLNQQRDDGIFYHPTQSGYYKFEYENLKPGISQQYTGQEIARPISVSMKQ